VSASLDNGSSSPPQDIVDWERAPPPGGSTYRTGPRSMVVLFARLDAELQSAAVFTKM